MPRSAPLSLREIDRILPQRFAAWVRWASILVVGAYGLLLALDLAGVREQVLIEAAGEAVAAILGLVGLVLTSRGRPAGGVLVLMTAVAAEVHWGIFLDAGLAGGGAVALPVLVLAGGTLLGGRWPLVLPWGFVVSVTLVLFAAGVRRGVGFAVLAAEVDVLVVLALALAATGVLLYQGIRGFEGVLELARSRAERIAELIRSSPDAILVIDAEGRIRRSNPAAETLFGVPADRLGGRLLDDLGLDDPEGVQRIRRGADQPVSLRLTRPDGDVRSVEATSGFHRENGSRGQVLLRDVTERVRTEERRRAMERELRHAQRLQSLGTLAGGIAHDFNNIFTVIRATAELLRLEAEAPEERQLAADLLRVEERGALLIRKLLTFARREPTRTERLVLAHVVSGTEVLLRSIVGPGVELRVALHDPGWIHADQGQLEQVLVNLVSNARDAMGEGGHIDVVVRSETGAGGRARHVVLEVVDDGRGMTPDVEARIFDPFFSTRPLGEASGLGLSTVLGIVEQGDGTIEVETAPGRGTRIRIRWPADPPPGPDPAGRDETVAGGAGVDDRGIAEGPAG